MCWHLNREARLSRHIRRNDEMFLLDHPTWKKYQPKKSPRFVCKMCAEIHQKINQKAEMLHIWKIRVYQTYGYYAVTLGCYLVGVTSVTRCRLGPGEGPETPDFSIEVQLGEAMGSSSGNNQRFGDILGIFTYQKVGGRWVKPPNLTRVKRAPPTNEKRYRWIYYGKFI